MSEYVREERDCENCVRHTGNGCTSWDCRYLNRENAIRASEERNLRNTEVSEVSEEESGREDTDDTDLDR